MLFVVREIRPVYKSRHLSLDTVRIMDDRFFFSFNFGTIDRAIWTQSTKIACRTSAVAAALCSPAAVPYSVASGRRLEKWDVPLGLGVVLPEKITEQRGRPRGSVTAGEMINLLAPIPWRNNIGTTLQPTFMRTVSG
ncbi:hypothetical protein EVAR_53798_1 [Eumeta japonica]|uniref:Uncharacterized protein n=1 Tax=Eumeta variegata TaxID=151549 RepID=A0A4C1XZ15_EUMVA|nr:hypothetical protein EVAR_53798_1 [Eumeta japonica]